MKPYMISLQSSQLGVICYHTFFVTLLLSFHRFKKKKEQPERSQPAFFVFPLVSHRPMFRGGRLGGIQGAAGAAFANRRLGPRRLHGSQLRWYLPGWFVGDFLVGDFLEYPCNP